MNLLRSSVTLFAFVLLAAPGLSAADRAQALPRSAPEKQGVSSAALLGFIDEAESKINALHSVMIVRRGHVIAEGWWAPYAAEEPHQMFSLSKSFTSTAVGGAQAGDVFRLQHGGDLPAVGDGAESHWAECVGVSAAAVV
jgi:hypothetical protein